MSKKKKKTPPPQAQQQSMSPLQYVKSGRARKLPLFESYINPDWKEAGLSSILVSRKHTTGNVTFGFYLVDTFCLGVKNCDVGFNRTQEEFEEFLEGIEHRHNGIEKIDYTLAHNILYGAVAYAEDLGFAPHKDWSFSQMILEEDTEDIELIEIEFGKNGKPHFINGPFDKVPAIIEKLKKSVGEGNFDVLLMDGNAGNDYWGDMNFDDDDDDESDDDAEDVEYEEIKG